MNSYTATYRKGDFRRPTRNKDSLTKSLLQNGTSTVQMAALTCTTQEDPKSQTEDRTSETAQKTFGSFSTSFGGWNITHKSCYRRLNEGSYWWGNNTQTLGSILLIRVFRTQQIGSNAREYRPWASAMTSCIERASHNADIIILSGPAKGNAKKSTKQTQTQDMSHQQKSLFFSTLRTHRRDTQQRHPWILPPKSANIRKEFHIGAKGTGGFDRILVEAILKTLTKKVLITNMVEFPVWTLPMT